MRGSTHLLKTTKPNSLIEQHHTLKMGRTSLSSLQLPLAELDIIPGARKLVIRRIVDSEAPGTTGHETERDAET